MGAPDPRRARGFTLLEVLIAAAIGIGVMLMITNAYLGANKAQAVSVGGTYLKMSGEAGITDIYKRLKSARYLFDRPGTDPKATKWLQRSDLMPYLTTGLSPQVETAELVLPLIKSTASFWPEDAMGSPNPDWDQAAVGNALFFVSLEPQVLVADTTASPKPINQAFGVSQSNFLTYRLNLYYLAKREFGTSGAQVRLGSDYTYQLMFWQSKPYMDYNELKTWMQKLIAASPTGSLTGTKAFIDSKLTDMADVAGMAGALDLGVSDASMASATPALFDLQKKDTAYDDLAANSSKRFENDRFRSALQYNTRNSFAECMVAFNTKDCGTDPGVPAPDVNKGLSLAVPAYGDPASCKPYGMEIMIGGAPGSRQVMARLALAARSSSGGKTLTGMSFQQVIQVAEY